jgi:alpha-D-ribose 1-methylphosphonate 5-triphosphate diphosphatase PhnM
MTERAKGARRSPEAKAEYYRDKLKKAEQKVAANERNLDTRCKVIMGATMLILREGGDLDAMRIFDKIRDHLPRQQDRTTVDDWLAFNAKKRSRSSGAMPVTPSTELDALDLEIQRIQEAGRAAGAAGAGGQMDEILDQLKKAMLKWEQLTGQVYLPPSRRP